MELNRDADGEFVMTPKPKAAEFVEFVVKPEGAELYFFLTGSSHKAIRLDDPQSHDRIADLNREERQTAITLLRYALEELEILERHDKKED